MLGRAIWVRKKKATPTAAHTVHLVVCPESICRFRLLLPYGSLHVSDPARVTLLVVMLERAASVVGRVDEHTLHLARDLRLQRLQRQQVVPEDQLVVEDIVLRHPMRRVIRPLRVFQQNARLQLAPVLLANPGEFKFCTFCLAHSSDATVSIKKPW